MEDKLNRLFKKYVLLFIDEYQGFLSKNQLDDLRKLNYDHLIEFKDMNKPFGEPLYGKIYLPNIVNELINNFASMPNYNTMRSELHNKNLSSYLKYMCDNGYQVEDYYQDILLYFVFFFVIKNHSSFIYGLINQEIEYLSIKYNLRCANLFAREEKIVSKVTPILKMEGCRRLIFSDKATSFKYLNEQIGFRYANLIDEISSLMDNEYDKLKKKEYEGFSGFLDYMEDYDHLSYGSAYSEILDFEVQNSV